MDVFREALRVGDEFERVFGGGFERVGIPDEGEVIFFDLSYDVARKEGAEVIDANA